MKRNAVCLCLFLAIAAVVIPARADAGVSLGFSSWYAWWEMKPDSRSTVDPAPLYGPVLGVDFAGRWSLTSVLLTGKFVDEDDMFGDVEYRRYDSDSAINYSLNRYFKIFAGFKYMRYDMSIDSLDIELKHISYGPGLGIGVTIPISDSLFAIANVSGMYLFGTKKALQSDYYETGVNSALGLAYYIMPIATTITAGVRYQYFETRTVEDDTNHHFYGVTLSAVWHFSTGSSDGE